jgi:hypothetical protein
MCGIVGMAGDIVAADRQVFRDMLDVCQIRGRDSTGVININRTKSYGFIKNVGPPAYLFDRKGYDQIVETGFHSAFIGHCRHKTSGAVNVQNAHPFDFEEEGIIGVHNGTLRGYHQLDGYTYAKVDSEVLYEHLAKNGPEETFNKIEGAWACVWWDDTAETLNFIRNDERPMYFCWSEDKRKMFWASETWMFGAAERKIPMWKGPKGDYKGKYIELPVDTLWSFSIDPSAKKGEATVRMKPAKKIPRKTNAMVARQPWGAGGNVVTSGFSAGGSAIKKEETAVSIWNQRCPRTHHWDGNTRRWAPKMLFAEWEEQFNREQKEKGGSVPNPFHQKLDDQLPVHLRPKQETLALIQGGKSGIGDSKQNSSLPSKNGSEQEKPAKSTESGCTSTNSPVPETSTSSPKTNRKKLSARLQNLQQGNGGYSPSKVSFRSMVGMAFITDEQTGSEYSEAEVQENTKGACSFCDEPIGDLTEISEFFGKNKFICTNCTEPSLRSVA